MKFHWLSLHNVIIVEDCRLNVAEVQLCDKSLLSGAKVLCTML